MPNEYGDYAESVDFPYREWTTVEQARQFPWPNPDWYDYEVIRELVQDKNAPVKAKTAYQILKQKHNLKARYESFKGFVRAPSQDVFTARRQLLIGSNFRGRTGMV